MSIIKSTRILSKELGSFSSGCSSLVPLCSLRDHCPVQSSDHHGLSNEMSMYDASPTAVYIYEQEKNDMQCIAPAASPSFSPCMDLPELKQSDVSNYLWGPDKPACSWSVDDEIDSDDLLNMSEIHDFGHVNIEDVFQRDQDPTLAELNGPALSAILNESPESWKRKGWKQNSGEFNPEIEALIKREWDALNDPQETKRRQRRPSEVDKKWEELRDYVDYPEEMNIMTLVKKEPGSCSQLRRFLTSDDSSDWTKLVKTERAEKSTCVKTEPASQSSCSPPDATAHAQIKTEVPVATPSEDDSELDEDQEYSSDAESIDSFHGEPASKRRRKEPRYFWQYNAQSKGPKGTKLYIPQMEEDPHVLHAFEDPVFDPEQTSSGNIRHSGKARRGDGNDIMPSPMKLQQIGGELKKLNKVIDQLTPAGDAPVTVKTRSKREKNKLASRACRLKKKAQHEANKIKLHGLEEEHSQLIRVLELIKKEVCDHVTASYHSTETSLSERVDRLLKVGLTSMIAGNTTEYVNSVLERTEAGDPSGGLRQRVY